MQRTGNPRVSVVVPTRNEARNLEVVLPAIAAVRPAVHEIIVVDGNSVDGTIETAQRVLPWVKVITQTRKGKGNAMACGFAACTGEVIVMFDADGSADPAEIPDFVSALVAGADFAKGSRFVRGGGSDDITLLRKSGNAGLNGMANALFGTSYTDLCYGYNAFWADLLPLLELPPIEAPAPADGSMLWGDGFEIETVLNCRVAAAGLKIREVPSMERERIFGHTNLRTFADGTRVLRTLAAERRRAQRRRAERVQVEVESRALTPPRGFPVVPPAPAEHSQVAPATPTPARTPGPAVPGSPAAVRAPIAPPRPVAAPPAASPAPSVTPPRPSPAPQPAAPAAAPVPAAVVVEPVIPVDVPAEPAATSDAGVPVAGPAPSPTDRDDTAEDHVHDGAEDGHVNGFVQDVDRAGMFQEHTAAQVGEESHDVGGQHDRPRYAVGGPAAELGRDNGRDNGRDHRDAHDHADEQIPGHLPPRPNGHVPVPFDGRGSDDRGVPVAHPHPVRREPNGHAHAGAGERFGRPMRGDAS